MSAHDKRSATDSRLLQLKLDSPNVFTTYLYNAATWIIVHMMCPVSDCQEPPVRLKRSLLSTLCCGRGLTPTA